MPAPGETKTLFGVSMAQHSNPNLVNLVNLTGVRNYARNDIHIAMKLATDLQRTLPKVQLILWDSIAGGKGEMRVSPCG
jgi:hypothetical protein